jgi:hypothetical protein
LANVPADLRREPEGKLQTGLPLELIEPIQELGHLSDPYTSARILQEGREPVSEKLRERIAGCILTLFLQ